MRTKPRHRSVDTPLLVGAHEVHAVVGLAGAEDRNLGHAVAMRDVILNQHLAQTVGWCQRVDIAVVVVWSNLGDDGNLTRRVEGFAFPIAPFDNGEPKAEVNRGITGQTCPAISGGNGWHGHIDGAYRINRIRPIHAHPRIDVGIVVRERRPVPRLGIDVISRGPRSPIPLGFSETTSEHAR